MTTTTAKTLEAADLEFLKSRVAYWESHLSEYLKTAGAEALIRMVVAVLANRDSADRHAALAEAAQAAPESAQPVAPVFKNMPNPTPMDLVDPLFEAIWQAAKSWDVNAPEHYNGYCGFNGSHVMLILNKIRALYTHPAPERVALALTPEQITAAVCTVPPLEGTPAYRAIERAVWAANGLTAPTKEST